MVSSKRVRRQGGFTLIEMLVAVLILSVGLLGLAGLQALSLRNNVSAAQRSVATVAANDILDRMRANRAKALAGSYNTAWTDTGSATDCDSGSTRATRDVNCWLVNLATELPDGDGMITCTSATGICEVIVRWNDSRNDETASSFQTFVVSAQL